MSNTRTSTVERNGNSSKGIKLTSPWSRAITSNSEWQDKVCLNEIDLTYEHKLFNF